MKKLDAKKEMDALIKDCTRMKLNVEQANYYKIHHMWLILVNKINEIIGHEHIS